MSKEIGSAVAILIILCGDVYGHDTTHIHPLITLEIAKLIKDKDTVVGGDNAYSDIYEPNLTSIPGIDDAVNFLYWGTDFDPLELAGKSDAEKKSILLESDPQLVRYERNNNVIDGVVFEDRPSSPGAALLGLPDKVRHHFYQGNSGDALSIDEGVTPVGDPSSIRAMGFFNHAIEILSGYTEESKHEAFFVFGQALHHVEDMTSPAHIHNDPHLTYAKEEVQEHDDYEGWWLPQQKIIHGDNLAAFFSDVATIEAVINPWDKIWGINKVDSLVRLIYDATTYGANLDYLLDIQYVQISGGYNVITRAPGQLVPSGELRDMFPCLNAQNQYDENISNCLYWENEKVGELSHWRINAVGDFHHQFYNYYHNSWWPVEYERDKTPSTASHPVDFPLNKFYIEQLAENNSSIIPEGNPVIPDNMRINLIDPASAIEPNLQTMSDIYANKLLTPAVTYGAGFTQYWYDVANTPPYLKAVSAKQKPNSVSTEAVVYEAKWDDNITWIMASSSPSVSVTDSRKLTRSLDKIKHIDNNEDLIIELEFNEPIKEISILRIGKHNTGGACVELRSSCLDILSIPGMVPVKSESDAKWIYIIPNTAIVSLDGKLIIEVNALDKNNHADGIGGTDGGELDGRPETPAKRDISRAMDILGNVFKVNEYPWYQTDGLEGKNDKYSYDAGIDSNHVLVFDTKGPTAIITIDLTL